MTKGTDSDHICSVDYDHELSNGWGKWQNLVLQGLKDNADNQRTLVDDVQQIKVDLALVKQQTSSMNVTISSQGGEIKLLRDDHTYVKGIWRSIAVTGACISAAAGVVLGILTAVGVI